MPIRYVRLLASFLVLTVSWSMAQGVRSLGMGGVVAPGGASTVNPAYAALPSEPGRVEIPLPLGLLSLLTNPAVDYTSDQFDLLTVLDQVTHLDTLLLAAAASPDEVVFRLRETGEGPRVAIDLEGGSPLAFVVSGPVSISRTLALPVGFRAFGVDVGIRPFVDVDSSLTPDASWADLFLDGTTAADLQATLRAEAGVALDVSFASAVPLPGSVFPGTLYVGVRGSPFVGLARIDGAARIDVEADAGTNELAYLVDGDAFVSLVTDGQVGFGVRADLGVVAVLPVAQGTVTVGASVLDVQYASWTGSTYTIDASQDAEFTFSDPVAGSQARFGTDVAVLLTGAIDLDVGALGIDDLASLLIAADAGYGDGALSGHVGVEAGIGGALGAVKARAGVGYADGLTFGVGAGIGIGRFGFDAALHGYRAPLTEATSFGVTAAIAYGF